MKLIKFKVKSNLGVVYFREGTSKDNFEELWIPEDKIFALYHEYDCGKDSFHINDYEITKEEFDNILKQIQGE